MSRDAGFQIGDRSTRTLYDVRLVRATRKAGLAAIVAWDAIVDASWESGCRVGFDDAVDTLPYDLGDTSATGVAFSRNPATGENKFYGEWLRNAQGDMPTLSALVDAAQRVQGVVLFGHVHRDSRHAPPQRLGSVDRGTQHDPALAAVTPLRALSWR